MNLNLKNIAPGSSLFADTENGGGALAFYSAITTTELTLSLPEEPIQWAVTAAGYSPVYGSLDGSIPAQTVSLNQQPELDGSGLSLYRGTSTPNLSFTQEGIKAKGLLTGDVSAVALYDEWQSWLLTQEGLLWFIENPGSFLRRIVGAAGEQLILLGANIVFANASGVATRRIEANLVGSPEPALDVSLSGSVVDESPGGLTDGQSGQLSAIEQATARIPEQPATEQAVQAVADTVWGHEGRAISLTEQQLHQWLASYTPPAQTIAALSTSATAYVSIVSADTIISAQVGAAGYQEWPDLSNEQKGFLLEQASLSLDGLLNWKGSKTDAAQALEWPRDGATEPPRRILLATCMLALDWMNGQAFKRINREKLGEIENEYATSQWKVPDAIIALVRPLSAPRSWQGLYSA